MKFFQPIYPCYPIFKTIVSRYGSSLCLVRDAKIMLQGSANVHYIFVKRLREVQEPIVTDRNESRA